MNTEDSNQQNEPMDVELLFELDRISKLEKEFLDREEARVLLSQRDGLYEILYNALPEGFKDALVDYSDTRTHLNRLMIKLFYKQGFIESAATTQLLLGSGRVKLDIHIT